MKNGGHNRLPHSLRQLTIIISLVKIIDNLTFRVILKMLQLSEIFAFLNDFSTMKSRKKYETVCSELIDR